MPPKKYHVTFLCTDNVGRSIIAEYCLRDYLEKNNIDNIVVSSAGTNADSDTAGFSWVHLKELKNMGIDAIGYKRTQMSQQIIDESDLIVCMAENHRKWMMENFDLEPPLFNEIYKNETVSISVDEPDEASTDRRMIEITHYIHDAMPEFVKNMMRILNQEWTANKTND